jgi:EAL domain-containing protein (putative c-di-GMP-specific phosphodiesterase class I)
MLKTLRLLGFAFANADLLFETDTQGKILFALGSMNGLGEGSSEQLVGKDAKAFFETEASARFARELGALSPGGRTGSLSLRLANGARASLSLCRLPDNGDRISCTLTKSGVRAALPGETRDAQTGLPNKDAFIARVSEMTESNGAVSIVNVRGLAQHCQTMPAQDADKLLQRVGHALKKWSTKVTGRVGDTMFGAFIEPGAPTLGDSMRKILVAEGVNLPVEEANVAMNAEGLSGEQRMLALRFVVDNFDSVRRGHDTADLASAFDKMLTQTQLRALNLAKTVAAGDFELAFMPIVKIGDGALAHYECLARFNAGNTGETIQFAESLGISDAFDLAVAVRILSLAEQDKTKTGIAFNISGRTIQSPASFGLVAGLLAKKRAQAKSVLIEITETVEITDLHSANDAIQTLRQMGYRVGLDDFGAGAASFQYLQNFHVDFVKFDGALIRRIGASKREDTLLTGLLEMCRALGIETIAEGIEDEKMLAQVRTLGFDLGQGYLFGKAATGFAEAQALYQPQAKKLLKRQGVKERWG